MMGFTHVGGWGGALRAGRRAAGGAGLRCRGGGFQSKKLARLSKVRVQVARRRSVKLLAVKSIKKDKTSPFYYVFADLLRSLIDYFFTTALYSADWFS